MTANSAGTSRTSEEISAWLRERVSYYLNRPSETIDPEGSLASYGLDSVYVFALTAEIEDEYDLRLEPTLLWDKDTLVALTGHIVALASA
jgi:acyl carrier protein